VSDEAKPGSKASGEIAKKSAEDAEGAEGGGKLRWILGWVVLPGTLIGGIFGGGALVGAHFHESWFTRAIVWIVEVF
jgi:hypothetical protein